MLSTISQGKSALSNSLLVINYRANMRCPFNVNIHNKKVIHTIKRPKGDYSLNQAKENRRQFKNKNFRHRNLAGKMILAKEIESYQPILTQMIHFVIKTKFPALYRSNVQTILSYGCVAKNKGPMFTFTLHNLSNVTAYQIQVKQKKNKHYALMHFEKLPVTNY